MSYECQYCGKILPDKYRFKKHHASSKICRLHQTIAHLTEQLQHVTEENDKHEQTIHSLTSENGKLRSELSNAISDLDYTKSEYGKLDSVYKEVKERLYQIEDTLMDRATSKTNHTTYQYQMVINNLLPFDYTLADKLKPFIESISDRDLGAGITYIGHKVGTELLSEADHYAISDYTRNIGITKDTDGNVIKDPGMNMIVEKIKPLIDRAMDLARKLIISDEIARELYKRLESVAYLLQNKSHRTAFCLAIKNIVPKA